jgi:dTDP-glucose 4,6-dehydratase/UDP-glucose 4-epimerase
MPDHFELHTCDIVAARRSSRHWLINPRDVRFEELFESTDFDVCINCSGAASVGESHTDPRRDYELNVVNVVRLLDAIRRYRPACRFLNLSSAAVYGNPAALPVSETSKVRPISPYGLHKLQAEQLCSDYARFFEMNTCSVRIFSAYGPGLRKQLLWDLHRKAQSGSRIELWGTGRESRDFIEVSDLCLALRLVCEHSAFEGEVVNVASGQEITIEYVVRLFIDFYNENHTHFFNGRTKTGDPLNWRADIGQLRCFGFEPEVLIEQGIRRYVEWVKDSE